MAHHSDMSASPQHDIFLSHSGAQKGFVTDLFHELKSRCFRPFFDASYDSLPLAESFPPHILAAASSCNLALVILSDEYLSSKWPMIELCLFMEATSNVKILPIFFHLSPSDLKEESNKRQWVNKWKSFAEVDPRITVSRWEKALKSLCSMHGIIYGGTAREGEKSFIERIIDSIRTSQTLVPQSIYDTSDMQGGDRLLRIILDKFEEMESGQHGPQHESLEGPSTTSIAPQCDGIASILGIYGYPGSGKSTLCRGLQGYFSPRYPAGSLCLNLPTDPTPSDIMNEIGRTFGLTTSVVAHIDQVMSLLRNHPRARKSIFLVVDNICDKSCEVVQRILHSVIGPGSKVVVVARSLDLLRPALAVIRRLGHEGVTCICDTIPMPTLNEEEATKLLIMEAERQGYGIVAGPHQLDLMKEKDNVLRVVRFSGFRRAEYSNNGLLYLPLVVKRMGVMLARYENDIDGWARGQEKVWSSFDDEDLKIYRNEVVHELIWESFKDSLGEQLQWLFLDVALYLKPSRVCEFHEACSILSSMHGEGVAVIKKLLRDLKRLCFIDEVSESGGIFVHDVYVEFAKSIQKKKLSPWSYIWNEDIQWDALMAGTEMKLLEEENAQRPVRAITFKVKEGYQRIDLKGFSSLKALVLRNCGSLVALRMAGLTSLAILEITGFRVSPRLECYDCNDPYASVRNVKRLILRKYDVINKQQAQGRSVVSWNILGQMLNYVPAFVKKPISSLELAKHMKGLQVLRLEGTGVRNLEYMGSCSWPHLQELSIVNEYFLEGIRLGTLPALKIFFFQSWETCCWRAKRIAGGGQRELLVEGKDLLKGCPALQDVYVGSGLFKNVELMKPSWRGLRVLRLWFVRSSMEKLGDAISSAGHTLERLEIRYCDKIERVNVSAGQLPSLTKLTISNCERVMEVKFGLQALPSLTSLRVEVVSEMCVLSGLEEWRMLKELELVDCCSMLQPSSCSLTGLVRLEVLRLVQTCRAWELHRALDFKSAGFEGLSNLKRLQIAAADTSRRTTPINLASLTGLQELTTDGTLLLEGVHNLQKLESLEVQTWMVDSTWMLPELGTLHLDKFSGIKQLRRLWVEQLTHLRRLDGIECLTHLRSFGLDGCPLLEELPSLHALHDMRHLQITTCAKLKSVRGCDEMRKLKVAGFSGCHSMEQPPFKDMYALGRTHPHLTQLDFRCCGFAMDTKRELLMMEDWSARGVTFLLGRALLYHLFWEFHLSSSSKEEWWEFPYPCGMWMDEAIVSCLLSALTLYRADKVGRISSAWRSFVKHVVAGKLKKGLLTPGVVASLSKLVQADHVMEWLSSPDREKLCSMYGKSMLATLAKNTSPKGFSKDTAALLKLGP